MSEINRTVKAPSETVKVDDDTPLVGSCVTRFADRDKIWLSAAMGVCGSCTILEKGKAIRSCQIPRAGEGTRFRHDRRISKDASHPCPACVARGRKTWLQCGFCQPGMDFHGHADCCASIRSRTDKRPDRRGDCRIQFAGAEPTRVCAKQFGGAAAALRTQKKP